MARQIRMKLLVEPDDQDTRSGDEIADDVSMTLIDSLRGSGIAIATEPVENLKPEGEEHAHDSGV